MVIITLLLGLVALTVGAEWLVRRASELASMVGISPLVVGLTVVAFGTSAPELVVSLQAALTGQPDVAVGNVVGSNLFNLMGVLGLSSLVSPVGVAVSDAALRVDVPVMVAVAAVCFPVFLTGRRVSRLEAALLLTCYVAYVAYLIRTAGG